VNQCCAFRIANWLELQNVSSLTGDSRALFIK
jgi:hypothetical protein